MKEIFRLALRNLSEHKSKTIIISLFLVFGMAIVVLGNSFLESINRGLEKDFRQNYTGDLVISIQPEKGTILDIFGVAATANIGGEIPQVPAIPDLKNVEEIVHAQEGIKGTTKQISAQILIAKGKEMDMSDFIENDDLGFDDLPISMLFGVEESYWDLFPKVNLVEGRYPQKDTNEVMIDTRVKNAFESLYKKPLNVGDDILMLGANTNGVIREGKLVGIFDPPNENSAMFQIVYCDPNLARAFADLTYAANFESELPSYVDFSISELSEDDLFGSSDDDLFGELIEESDEILRQDTTDFSDILGDTTLRDELNKTDEGAWNFILAKVQNPSQTKKVIEELKTKFADANLNVQVMDWKAGAYSYSGTVEGIGFIFNLLIIILAVVVFIIIMNTMVVSVIERTGEIGTMRAIGAEKSFVKKLFFTETLFLTVVSSIVGFIIAFIAMAIFNSLEITITNSIAKMILGGGLLHFSPTVKIIVATFFVAILGSILSNLYPISSALKITPLKALSKGSD